MTVAVVLGRRVSPEISGLNLLLVSYIETEFSSCGYFVSGDRQTFTLLLILTYWRDDRRLSSYLTSICFMHTLLNHIMIGLTSYLPPHYLPSMLKGFPALETCSALAQQIEVQPLENCFYICIVTNEQIMNSCAGRRQITDATGNRQKQELTMSI